MHYHIFGMTWGPIVEVDALPIRDATGRELEVPNRLCYSTSAPHLELIEERSRCSSRHRHDADSYRPVAMVFVSRYC